MTFEDWIKLAFPWLSPNGADYNNLKEAFRAGYKAAKEQGDYEV